MADIKLIDAQGDERTYSGVAKVKIPLADGTGNATFIQPANKKELTDTNEVDVTNFATAQVVDENLVAENIKSGVTVLGIVGTHEGGSGGSCSGNHIIDVAELPTENIDENALYKCGDSYHQYAKELKDIIVVSGGSASSIVDMYSNYGLTFELYIVKTRPTENIVVSGEIFACYYVEDENDILLYGDLSGSGTNEWASFATMMSMTNQGAITDISEVTEDGCYALVDNCWKNYILPSGSVTITECGTVDVTRYESATIEVVSVYTVQTVDELPTDALNGSMAIVLRG